MRNGMTVYEIVKKLVGEIRPVGETNEDNRRYANLDEMITLVDKLLYDLGLVAVHKDSHMFSVKDAGQRAAKFLKDISGAMPEAEEEKEGINETPEG